MVGNASTSYMYGFSVCFVTFNLFWTINEILNRHCIFFAISSYYAEVLYLQALDYDDLSTDFDRIIGKVFILYVVNPYEKKIELIIFVYFVRCSSHSYFYYYSQESKRVYNIIKDSN